MESLFIFGILASASFGSSAGTLSYSSSFVSLAPQPSRSTCIKTNSGTVCGQTQVFNGKNLRMYRGIPFAQPPVGHLRFKRPLPVRPWTRPLWAVRPSPACVQHSAGPFPWRDDMSGQSEDCLYLDIWVPQDTTCWNTKAVMFWVYGGGYFIGSNRLSMYDGAALSAVGDVVVVTVNYRLGILGFHYSGVDDAPGCAAIFDVLEALKWVNANIESFGGNKEMITLFGASAGAITCSLLTISPLSRNLFLRAILESGSAATYVPDKNERASQEIAAKVGCASESYNVKNHPSEVTACLRKIDALELMKTQSEVSSDKPIYIAHTGNELLPKDPRQSLREGDFKDMDLLIGNNVDEGSFHITTEDTQKFGFFGSMDAPVNRAYASSFIKKRFPNSDIVRFYIGQVPDNDGYRLRHNAYSSFGDIVLLCPDVYIAEAFADRGNDVYFYYFDHRPSTSVWAPWMGVVHYEEVKFTFGEPLSCPGAYTQAEYNLSLKMIGIWSNFAKTGVPSEYWPKYSRETPRFVYLDTQNFTKIGYGPKRRTCDYLRSYIGL